MRRAAWTFALLAPLFFCPAAAPWGTNAQRLITSKAVETLPLELRGFYQSRRDGILAAVSNSMEAIERDPNQLRYHVLYLNRYSPFPYDQIPRDYKAAVAKFGRLKLEAAGLLPWQVGVYSQKLTDAFRKSDWEGVRVNSALLASFVAEAHDPFNMVEVKDPRTGTPDGIQDRFSKNLVERYSNFFPMRPNDAYFISDPTVTAFEDCFSAHSWIEIIEQADRRSRWGLSQYTDEYYDRFYNTIGAVLIRQLSDASTQVGSFWFTAWTNAGKPQLPQ